MSDALFDEVKAMLEVVADRIESKLGTAAMRDHIDLATRALIHGQHLPFLLYEEGDADGYCLGCGRSPFGHPEPHDRTCGVAERMAVLDPTFIEREKSYAWGRAILENQRRAAV